MPAEDARAVRVVTSEGFAVFQNDVYRGPYIGLRLIKVDRFHVVVSGKNGFNPAAPKPDKALFSFMIAASRVRLREYQEWRRRHFGVSAVLSFLTE